MARAKVKLTDEQIAQIMARTQFPSADETPVEIHHATEGIATTRTKKSNQFILISAPQQVWEKKTFGACHPNRLRLNKENDFEVPQRVIAG